MGLINEIDTHIGRIVDYLKESGKDKETLIVLTSDHGDYLGDHWLGEKELFHEESIRVPLIVVDPRPSADKSRGVASNALVEAIDLVPTFIEAAGGEAKPHLLEGRSLHPLLQGEAIRNWRDAVFSEVDYAWRGARLSLDLEPHETRGYMIRTEEYKYVSYDGFRPQLFDLKQDPKELRDLASLTEYSELCKSFEDKLYHWIRQRKTRITVTADTIKEKTDNASKRGIYFGVW